MKTLFRYLVVGVLAIIQTSWAATTFTLTSPSTTNITVAWSGSDTAFNITYGTNEALQTNHGSFSGASGSTLITGLAAGTKYMINVIIESMNIYSGSKYTKPAAPTGFAISSGTDPTTELAVTYIPPTITPITDTVYVIKYQNTSGPSLEIETSSPTGTSVPGLTPGEMYTVTIFTKITNGGDTETSVETAAQTKTTKPSLTTILQEVSSTTNTIEISYTEDNGVFDYYVFSINNVINNDQVINKNGPKIVVFSQLNPSTLYKIQARTRSGELFSQTTDISVLTNPVPPNISCSEQPTDITVTVQNPSDMGYYIWCTKQDESMCGNRNNARDNRGVLQFFFRKLEPYHVFKFTIYEELKKKDTTKTKKSENTTLRCQTQEAAPGKMDAFNITNLVSHPFQVDLSWKVPPTPNGVILGYWISYNGSHTPYPATSEIYLHIPSNINFTQQIDNLLAGYTYHFKMWSYNGAGNSTQKILQKTLKVAAPVIPAQHMSIAKPQTGLTTPTSAEITFTNVFSNKNGMIVGYSLFVIPIKDVNQRTTDIALAGAGTWAGQGFFEPQGIYIAISKCQNFFTDGDNCAKKLRYKRQTSPSFSPSLSQITVVVGKDDTCYKSSTNIFCNGPLTPNSMYRFILRAYNEKNEFTDAPITDPVNTHSPSLPPPPPPPSPSLPPPPSNRMFMILAIVLAVLAIATVIGIICLIKFIRKRKQRKGEKTFVAR